MGSKRKSKTLYIRKWINKPRFHSNGHVLVDVQSSPWENKDEKKVTIGGSFDIADCTRIISLSVDVHDKEDLENVLFKLAALKEAIERTEKFVKDHAEV